MNAPGYDHMADRTLADLVRERPARAATFDALGLDFCCHGEQTLREACVATGADIDEVLSTVLVGPAPGEARESDDRDEGEDWTALGPADLADHIVDVHHAWLRSELPDLPPLAAKVQAVHGDRHGELFMVRRLVDELTEDLLGHIDHEERTVFPAVRDLESGRPQRGRRVLDHVELLVAEHEATGEVLARLHDVTGGYDVPADGCASYRLLYETLAALESDTHLHVFKENSLLFPDVARLLGAEGERA
jgi:regulator of cell morphogenesis and NO signaling